MHFGKLRSRLFFDAFPGVRKYARSPCAAVLSGVDNLFVFVVIMSTFGVPEQPSTRCWPSVSSSRWCCAPSSSRWRGADRAVLADVSAFWRTADLYVIVVVLAVVAVASLIKTRRRPSVMVHAGRPRAVAEDGIVLTVLARRLLVVITAMAVG